MELHLLSVDFHLDIPTFLFDYEIIMKNETIMKCRRYQFSKKLNRNFSYL